MIRKSLRWGISHAVLVSTAIGTGILLTYILWAFAVLDTVSFTASLISSFAVQTLVLTASLGGALAGAAAARSTRTRGDAVMAGAAGAAIGFVIITLCLLVAQVVVSGTLEKQGSFTKMPYSTFLKALVFVIPAAAAGAIAGLARTSTGLSSVAPSITPPPFTTPLPTATAPTAIPAPPLVPPRPAAPPPGATAAAPILVQCPRCSTRIQAPAYRPAELMCPSCGFRGTLST